ncbi:hypothetical protein LX87_03503 [Larkinella arboricola]|uniref:Uncharacterized protein n=1 Tax=Larkinella arboricola TaxID=643671 RepID=A0A327WWC3_LARAB|nr:hypothetical protein [Larkinella arboricola]RAJ95755.1 hypothetical protein LX87_03503 [Larkinella arboricola]
MNAITPIFPCQSLPELLEFYELLGFEITYQQKSPNPYACLKRGWIRLDFYGLKQYTPGQCYHTCYILSEEVEQLYEDFTEALRQKYGKLPTRGLPRISQLRDKVSTKYPSTREFMFSDIAGTCIRIGKTIVHPAEDDYPEAIKAASQRLSLALDFAYKSEDEPDEYAKVAKVYDTAIARDQDKPCENLFKVMVHRAELAADHGEPEVARELLQTIQADPYFQQNRPRFKAETARMSDIAKKLPSV